MDEHALPTPAPTAAAAPPASRRLAHIDALRGVAVAQMIVYHFIYDLKLFGWISVALTRDQPWVGWRAAIVTQFLLLVGVGLSLRDAYRPSSSAFIARWLRIAGAAALVSAGSALVFGPRFIWFGVLHFVAVALLLGRPLLRFGAWNVLPAAIILVLGMQVALPAFDPPWASWIGFPVQRPRTEDYVPLFPWFGVVLLGMVAGQAWGRIGYALPAPLRGVELAPPRLLRFLGAWPLTVYLVHQPVLLAVLWTVKKLTG